MSKFIPGWYVLYTRPRHEKKVVRALSDANVQSFLPTTRVLRTWCDRKKFIDVALFPSYVFIYVKDITEFHVGADAESVLHYVRFGKEIVRVSDAIISSIKLLADKGKDVEVSYDYFHPGQRLYIQRGPLTGLSCEIIRVNGNHKILIRVSLLQRSLLATLPPEDLVAISA